MVVRIHMTLFSLLSFYVGNKTLCKRVKMRVLVLFLDIVKTVNMKKLRSRGNVCHFALLDLGNRVIRDSQPETWPGISFLSVYCVVAPVCKYLSLELYPGLCQTGLFYFYHLKYSISTLAFLQRIKKATSVL